MLNLLGSGQPSQTKQSAVNDDLADDYCEQLDVQIVHVFFIGQGAATGSSHAGVWRVDRSTCSPCGSSREEADTQATARLTTFPTVAAHRHR